jgi:hypothetical protein
MNTNLTFFGKIPDSLRMSMVDFWNLIASDLYVEIAIYFDESIPTQISRRFNVLILMEPPAVMPENYASANLEKAQLIISLSPWRAKSIGTIYWSFQPIEIPSNFLDIKRVRENKLVIINDHKFGATKSSLYGYRRKLIKDLERHRAPVDLFGPNWDMGHILELRKRVAAYRRSLRNINESSFMEAFSEFGDTYKSYQGQAVDKISVMNSYKYALIVENDTNSLTEKIFDALYARCVVFYRGPDLKKYLNFDLPHIPLPESVQEATALILSYLNEETRLSEDETTRFSLETVRIHQLTEESIAREITNHILTNVKDHKNGVEE